MEPPKADFAETMSKLGETINVEHDIGHICCGYMNLVMSEAHLDMMGSINRALDTNNILNPTKII